MPPRITPEYTPVPTVRPEDPKTPEMRIDFPSVRISDALGEAMGQVGRGGYGVLSEATKAAGHAYDNLGNAFAHVGQEMWQRAIGLQELENETRTNKAEIEYQTYEAQQKLEVDQMVGDAASPAVLAAKQKEWEQKRNELREKLPPTAQRAFDSNTTGVLGRLVNHTASHFATQMKISALGAAEAKIKLEIKAASETDSPEQFAQSVDKIRRLVEDTVTPIKGYKRDQTEADILHHTEDAVAAWAAKKAPEDPTTARKFLEENESLFLDKEKFNRVMNSVRDYELHNQSRNIGDRVQNEMPDASLDDKEKRAAEMAREVNPKNPMLVYAARAAASERHHKHNQDIREAKARNWETVQDGLYGFGHPEGKVPTTRDELFAMGEEYRKAYNDLPPAEKNKANHVMAKSARGDFPMTPATQARRWELEGMAINDPARFRELDLAAEEIPWADRTVLRNEQRRIIKEGIKLESDPKTQSVLKLLRSSGVLPKNISSAHEKRWNQYTGALRNALIAKEKDLKYARPLNEEEKINIGRMLIDEISGTGYFGTDYGREKLYETIKAIPEDMKQYMIENYPGLSDQEMMDRYIRIRMRDEYNKRYSAGSQPMTKEKPKPPVSGRR
jgi:hypothetical protein